jgi:hypothetical protein
MRPNATALLALRSANFDASSIALLQQDAGTRGHSGDVVGIFGQMPAQPVKARQPEMTWWDQPGQVLKTRGPKQARMCLPLFEGYCNGETVDHSSNFRSMNTHMAWNDPLRAPEDLIRESLASAKDLTLDKRLCHATNEALALAWATPYPLLFLPVLLEEKLTAARRYSERQRIVRFQSLEILRKMGWQDATALATTDSSRYGITNRLTTSYPSIKCLKS